MKLILTALSLTVTLADPSFAAKDKTFVYCSEGSPSSMNPQVSVDGATYVVTKAIYDGLLAFKYGETLVVPGLAESWKTENGGLNYTFKLRKGVKFHKTPYFTPSRDFNADDVLFTFNRMRLKEHPFHKVGGGSYEYFQSMGMESLVKDIKKIDSHTVEFVLSKPEAPFVANLAMDFASILSEEYGSKLLKEGTPEKIDVFPVGTGAFSFLRYDKDTMVRTEAHTGYWKAKPHFDKVIFNITTDSSVRFQKLKTGECHFISEPAPADIKQMKTMKNLNVVQSPGLNVGYLAMNTQKKPFDNKLVRQAVNMALNRASYIDAIYLGSAQVAKNPIPSSMWGYNKSTKDYPHNPEGAKELLKKAGFKDGFSTELWTLPVSRPYNPNGKKMGEMMQADLAKVGIKAKLVSFDWPTYLEKLKKGEHFMAQLGWSGDNGDPDNFLDVLLGCAAVKAGSNISKWCHTPYDDLIQRAKRTTDVARRTELYEKAQVIFKEEAPWVTLAHSVFSRAMSGKVSGYKINPLGADIIYPMDLQ